MFSMLPFDENHCRHHFYFFKSYKTKVTDCRHNHEFCAMTTVCLCVFAQHVALSATLRRIGEEVSKPPVQLTVPQCEDLDLPKSCSGAAGGGCRSFPIYRSPCPHTRIVATLIIIRTVTQGNNTKHTYTYCIFPRVKSLKCLFWPKHKDRNINLKKQ